MVENKKETKYVQSWNFRCRQERKTGISSPEAKTSNQVRPSWFKTHGDNESIENGNSHIKQLPVSTEEEIRIFEVIGRQSKTQQGDETISSDGGHSPGRNKRKKCYLTWKNCAQQGGCEDIYDRNRMPRLSCVVHLADPSWHRKDTITSNGEDKSWSGHDSDAGVLTCGAHNQH